MSTTTDYVHTGHTVVRGLVDRTLVDFLTAHVETLLAAGRLEGDAHVLGSETIYGEPAFETLLAQLTPAASEATGVALLPTYSYVRLYRRGQELVPHRDRQACEHSVTIHLGSEGAPEWPIHLRRGDEPAAAVVLGPGDGLFYRGADLLHWRDQFEGDWHLQAFLHWVDASGPYADRRFDGRPSLGRPASERQR